MSVILLEPPRPEDPNRCEDVVNAPLSACLFTGYIASVLKKHAIEVEIIHAHLYDWSVEQTITHLSKKNISLLCVHTLYLWEKMRDIFTMLSGVKSRNIRTHINLYGYYPTFAYKKILNSFPCVDSVTVGEPEFTTLDLAKHLISKRMTPESPSASVSSLPFSQGRITGLAYRDTDGKVTFYPRSPIEDLDQLPYPYRQDIDLYKKKNIATYIQGSRGCYGHCTFCYLNPFYGRTNQWRGRSAKNIFEEILTLSTEYSLKDFYFSDANFFGPGKSGQERAATLAELILAHDLTIRFGFECRVNDIEEHSLSKLVMAGLTNVFLGLESGDPASLRRFKKHTTVDENKRAIQLLREYGIEPTFGFLMFEPNSTLESIRNNFEFLQEMRIMTTPAVTAHLLYHRQTLFEGTPDYQSMIHQNTNTHAPFTTYEIPYKIKDPKVDIFSEIITTVCRAILSSLPKTFICNETTLSRRSMEPGPLETVNDLLIMFFEKTLSDFEADIIDYSAPTVVKEVSQKLICEIEANVQSLSSSNIK
ncbi:MAG: radical SAM protein [wastewater metagenome]|nr:radical SAM protein [Candidatus Loosdrechtia aerotolerans]